MIGLSDTHGIIPTHRYEHSVVKGLRSIFYGNVHITVKGLRSIVYGNVHIVVKGLRFIV